MTFAPKGGYQQPKNISPKVKEEKKLSSKNPEPDPKSMPAMSRPVSRTSLYYFRLFQQSWRWALATIAFDFCLLFFLPLVQEPSLTKEVSFILEIVIIILISISASWFFKTWLLSILSSWNTTRGSFFKIIEKNPLLVFALLGLVVAFEVFLKVGQIGVFSSILTIIIILGAIKPFRDGIRERIQKDKNIAMDLTAQVEAFNLRLFLLHFIPLVAARLTILLSVLAFPLSLHIEPNFLVSLSVGCIMLSLMQAEELYFMIVCPRCGTKTSRFLAQYKACLACLHQERKR